MGFQLRWPGYTRLQKIEKELVCVILGLFCFFVYGGFEPCLYIYIHIYSFSFIFSYYLCYNMVIKVISEKNLGSFWEIIQTRK